MHQVVIDSSVIVKWLNQQNEERLDQAESLLNAVRTQELELLAPELAKYEIGNVLLVVKKLSKTQAKEALEFFFSLPITFVPETQELAESAYKIGQELNITYYDAVFLSVAKQFEAILVTDNIKHQGKAKDIKVIPLAQGLDKSFMI